MKKSLFVLFFLSLCLSFVFGQGTTTTPVPPPTYEKIGGAIEYDSGSISGKGLNVNSEAGFVVVYIENAGGEDATNLEFRLFGITINDEIITDVKAVLDGMGFDAQTSSNATPFSEAEETTEPGGMWPTYRVSQPNRSSTVSTTALEPGGQGILSFKMEYLDETETPPVWKPIPKSANVVVQIWWTKGYRDYDRRPILNATDSDPASESKIPDVKDIEDNLENSNVPFYDLNKNVSIETANDENTSTCIVLPDILLATIGIDELKDGTITITNPYGLPLEMNTETSVFIMPYLPGGVEIIEETDDGTVHKLKKYLDISEGGGVFKNPNIITDTKINDNNEFEFKLCTTLDSGVPWARKDLKPGAFMIKGLILKIGGGLGNVEEWEIGDKLYVGAKGDMIWDFDISKMWHVITIVANE